MTWIEKYINTVICGDCLEVMKNIPDKSIDLVLTDPPYGAGYAGDTIRHKHVGCNWDNEIPSNHIYKSIFRISKNQVIWGGNYYGLRPSRCWLAWYKRDALPSMSNIELAWTSYDKNSMLFDYTIAETNGERVGFPTQKPIALMSWIINKYSKETDIILDPFLGSGTTAVACEKLGRKWIGIEISEKYCEIARARIKREQSQIKMF